jgi:hypothetical protein
MNTSSALRLLAAANDDAVLAAWAAVFDEHKMSPEADVSPYDCWEMLQGFLSSGVLSTLEYDSVNLKTAFFNGSRPTTGAIQLVLSRLNYLRANHEIHQEHPMSNAKPPMSAFSNEAALATREQTGLSSGPRPSSLAARPSALGLSSPFRSQQTSFAAPMDFKAISEPHRERQNLECRKVDANLYRGNGTVNCQVSCCDVPVSLIEEDANIVDEEDVGDGGGYDMHEYMFHGQCQSCGAMHHHSMSRPTPKENY